MGQILDSTDRKILTQLLKDARQQNTQLAEAVGLSPPPCWKRVSRLEQAGIIRGYTAVLDMEKLGYPEIALIDITLENHAHYPLEGVCEKLAALPEVLEVHITTGDFDCFIKVAISDTGALERFLREKLYMIDGVRGTRTSLSLRRFKDVQSTLI
ncbi:Lrp/AsnC family transcriptional regulator [Ciceribacter selenitireducens]|jgi:Lrp/AsnC family leucine-responsive transcriptional regulator|uniref:HTH asnC-type domain-containing protein n=1 Tax=Ciceribacter selenitireducens ATCC BAA-1503 TaxID=1336235 RepID=A0A376ADP8_9HYPH|nr:Lrp/AsnC family transcriptional regulator [Ciceribacter selenitireducens]SSC65979.1 unnamed protein product [Ciceribacter selenitireducens ATCC BAA-1503]